MFAGLYNSAASHLPRARVWLWSHDARLGANKHEHKHKQRCKAQTNPLFSAKNPGGRGREISSLCCSCSSLSFHFSSFVFEFRNGMDIAPHFQRLSSLNHFSESALPSQSAIPWAHPSHAPHPHPSSKSAAPATRSSSPPAAHSPSTRPTTAGVRNNSTASTYTPIPIPIHGTTLIPVQVLNPGHNATPVLAHSPKVEVEIEAESLADIEIEVRPWDPRTRIAGRDLDTDAGIRV